MNNSPKVQSIIFNSDKFTLKDAVNFLAKHNYKFSKMDKTKNYLRFRQIEPAVLRREGYNKYINKEVTDGINFILAYKH